MTYFIDLDGTVLINRKTKFAPGAKILLRTLAKRGHKIVLISERGPQDEGTDCSMEATKQFFIDMGYGHIPIAFGVQPGRIIVDDTAGAFVYHRQNRDWSEANIGELLRPKGVV